MPLGPPAPPPSQRARRERRERLLAVLVTALCGLVILSIGIYLGGHPDKLPDTVRDKLVDDGEAQTLDTALDLLEADYFRPVKREQLFERSLGGLTESLRDQFSAYIDAQDYKRFQEDTEGRFSGVGLTVSEDKRGLRINTVIPGSPAAEAKIRPGGLIVRAAGRSLAGRSSKASTALIKGREGTFVTIVVQSGKQRRSYRLRREQILVPSATGTITTRGGKKVMRLSLAAFTSGVHGEARAEIDRRLRQGAKGIVLDMRGNGGGLLSEARLVASIFLADGTVVVTRSRSRGEKTYRATGSSIPGTIPVVVLVDRNTASSSEIVAGALQDRKRGRVVGTRTFGKGVFQQISELPNGGALELTVGEYFLPGGRNLGGGGVRRGAGIRPQVRAADRPGTRRDEALEAAYAELLRELR